MKYSTYLINQIKCISILSLGMFLVFLGAYLSFFYVIFSSILILGGFVLLILGVYRKNKFQYEREEPRKFYVMRGKFR